MLVKPEVGGQRQVVVFVVGGNARNEPLEVQAQLLPSLLRGSGAASHQEDVGQRLVRLYIETLEVLVLQVQIVFLLLKLALFVSIAQVVFQGVALAVHLTLGVELENIQLLIVPVVAGVFEAKRVTSLADFPHLERDGVVLQRDVGIEILRYRQGQLVAIAVVCLDAVFAGLAVAVVDAEAQQGVVAHTPELLLVSPGLHAGRGEHLPHLVHLDIVAVHVHGAALYLGPLQAILVFLNRFGGQVLDIGDVVGEIKVETLGVSCHGGQP